MHISFKITLICILLISSITPIVQAQTDVIISVSDGNIYRVNTQTCTKTLLNNFESYLDIAICPNGKFYGLSNDGLFEVNLTSGNTNFLTDPGYSTCLVCDQNNQLYYMIDQDLYRYNPSTNSELLLGDVGYFSAGDLTFYQGVLYLASSDDRLIQINLNGNNITSVIDIGDMGQNIFGISTLSEPTANCEVNYSMIASYQGDIFSLNPNTATLSPLCLGIVSGNIYGGASLAESTPIEVSAGSDTTISICSTENSLNLPPLLSSGAAPQGTWHTVPQSAIQSNNQLLVAQLSAGTQVLEYRINSGSCQDTAYITVDLSPQLCACTYQIPNVISLNQDGLNDAFRIQFLEDKGCEFQKMEIYNRWGKLIHEGSQNNWDGTYAPNKKVQAGTYYYIATINEKQEKGYLTVLTQ